MAATSLDFRQTWLWEHVFVNPRRDADPAEQEFFKVQFLSMRDKVGHLVDRIAIDMPNMTVHDLTHIDSLWETASLVAEGSVNVSPPEGFVLGASFLLHDAAMSTAAYPGGISDIQQTLAWKDAVARWLQSEHEAGHQNVVEIPPEEALQKILPDVLRQLHAEQAEKLAEQAWISPTGEKQYLISDDELRSFYGLTIGQIAHSHWWSVQKIESELSEGLGGCPQKTRNCVDRIKIACLLRVADALQLDQLRAPKFLRTLIRPEGVSAEHWSFQEKLARPYIESDDVVFTTGQPFDRDDAEAWWLAYDTLSLLDRELRDVDLLLRTKRQEVLKASRVKGIGSPEALSKTVQTRGWRPVDARIKVSDVPRIVESLGGSKLYGDDPFVPIRELIQNAADAIQARRRFQNRPDNWGNINILIREESNENWLIVEDNGIGMSESVLTGPLLDFGNSFWRSSLVMEEFPGLVSSGMKAIGRFGIGFFSIFMICDIVRVISRRCDRGVETGSVLEIRGGPAGRPILWQANPNELPIDGGTRVEVLLKNDPNSPNGILSYGNQFQKRVFSLDKIVGSLAPALGVSIALGGGNSSEIKLVSKADDWLCVTDSELLDRLCPFRDSIKSGASTTSLLRPLVDGKGTIFGRAAITPGSNYFWVDGSGCVTVSGLRANHLKNVQGVLKGEALTAARDVALPIVPKEVLAAWATEQGNLILKMRLHEEKKANVAETIFECGGDIGELPIVRWGGEWLNTEDFKAKIRKCEELFINFDGDFTYDEEEDSMHPREFKDDFQEEDRIITVPKHDGNMIIDRRTKWPACLYDERNGISRLSEHVEFLIRTEWSEILDQYDESCLVGEANGQDVMRSINVFKRQSTSIPSNI